MGDEEDIPGEERVHFTERAALLADCCEHMRVSKYLEEARRAASRSLANGPSECCSHVFERLKSWSGRRSYDEHAG